MLRRHPAVTHARCAFEYLDALLAPALRRLRSDLNQAGVAMNLVELLARAALLAAAAAAVAFALGGAVLAPVGTACGLAAPFFWLKLRAMRRQKAFAAQFATALGLISATLREGGTLAQGMEAVTQKMPSPVRDEFAKAVAAVASGASTEEALAEMLGRVRNDDLELAVTAVVLERHVGGDLPEAFERIAYSMRQRLWMKRRRMRTLPVQAR